MSLVPRYRNSAQAAAAPSRPLASVLGLGALTHWVCLVGSAAANEVGQKSARAKRFAIEAESETSTRREAEAVARGGVSREACKSTEHTSMSGSVSRPKIPFSGPALHLQLAVSLVHMMRWHFCLLHMPCTAQPGCQGCH